MGVKQFSEVRVSQSKLALHVLAASFNLTCFLSFFVEW